MLDACTKFTTSGVICRFDIYFNLWTGLEWKLLKLKQLCFTTLMYTTC